MKNLPICCPCSAKEALILSEDGYICSNSLCLHNDVKSSFPIINGIPVLISEEKTDTVCRVQVETRYVERDTVNYSLLKKIIFGESKTTLKNSEKFLESLPQTTEKPNLLIVGGGERGSGTEKIWDKDKYRIISFDIYASKNTDLVCDAHYMPFNDGTFDGVWIQAVLEHVVDPKEVVSEIHRVLKPDGVVYAETPFMQQVHEAAYDFTRYTVLGHRYLFKNFELISMGGNKGPEVVLAWSIKYFVWGITRNKAVARLVGIIFSFLLRPFSLLMSTKSQFDASSGVFFLGRKRLDYKGLSHKQLIMLYDGQL